VHRYSHAGCKNSVTFPRNGQRKRPNRQHGGNISKEMEIKNSERRTKRSTPEHGTKYYDGRYPVTESDHSHVSGNSMRTLAGSFECPPLGPTPGTEDSFSTPGPPGEYWIRSVS